MDMMIAYCGMPCSYCPIYIATQKDDIAERRRLADSCSKAFNTAVSIGDINCDGCKAGGRLFMHCKACEVRTCASEKSIETCASCSSYSCEKLDAQLRMIPSDKPREILEKLRNKIVSSLK